MKRQGTMMNHFKFARGDGDDGWDDECLGNDGVGNHWLGS